VRDKVAAEAAVGDDGGSAGYDEPAQAQPGWHLAINGETVGPMSEDEVRQRYEAAEIDKDTAIWQEGFEDWLPLGDIDTFADLPDHGGGGAADDPFASANQDEYAAPRAGGFAAAAAPVASGFAAAAAPRDPEPQSPRVSHLTGQRNENSVLFSLDSLQALATGGGGGGGGAAAAAPRKPAGTTARGLATAAPSSEGSGLIDIRALGAMVGNQDQPSAAGSAGPSMRSGAEDAALPSFGGAGLGGLAATPLVPQTTPVEHAAAAAVPARSNAPLYFMMALMLLMVAGMAAYIFVFKEEPKEKIVEREVHVVPDVKSTGKDDEDKDKDEKKKDDEDEDADEDEDQDEEPGADGTKKPTGKTSKSKTSSSKTSPSSSSSSTPSTPSTSSSSSSSSTPKEDSSLDVDCILNPELAKCKKGSSSKSGPKAPAGASDPSLPEKLSQSDIKGGVDKVLAQARSCGSKHGAKPGEVVRVRLSISGATGSVSSASAQDPHNGTPLGNCVAAALKTATFSKFRSGSMGAVYPVRM
jgi:hypothetical protein